MTASPAGRDRRLARFAPEMGYLLGTAAFIAWPGWRAWSSVQVLLAYPAVLYLGWKALELGLRGGVRRDPPAATGALRSAGDPPVRDWAKWPVTMSLAGALAIVLFGLLWPLSIDRFDGSGLLVDRVDLPLDALRGAIVLGALGLAFGPTLERWATGPRRDARQGHRTVFGTHVVLLGCLVGLAVLAIGDAGLGTGLGRSLPLGGPVWAPAALVAVGVGSTLWFGGRWLPLYLADLLVAVSLGAATVAALRSWPPGVDGSGDLIRVPVDPDVPVVAAVLTLTLIVAIAAFAAAAGVTPPSVQRRGMAGG